MNPIGYLINGEVYCLMCAWELRRQNPSAKKLEVEPLFPAEATLTTTCQLCREVLLDQKGL
jgi:hypothetical protein